MSGARELTPAEMELFAATVDHYRTLRVAQAQRDGDQVKAGGRPRLPSAAAAVIVPPVRMVMTCAYCSMPLHPDAVERHTAECSRLFQRPG